jgi:RNA polymerase subunit RPABC4/transcription elongation factor Spt4
MSKEKPTTKICKHCKTEIPYDAKVCPQCRKKVTGGKLKWIIIAVVVILIIAAVAGGSGGSSSSTPQKVGTVGDTSAEETSTVSETPEETAEAEPAAEETSAEPETEEKTAYQMGDILMDGDMKIVYVASGVYEEENEYSQPQDGNQYIYLKFAFENTSDSSDDSISFYSFECYADGYNVDMYYGGEEDLSATLSAGRSTIGYVYFEVPVDAQEIEVEYETNFITSEKILFLYEGEKDSGYVPESNLTPTDGAFAVGDVVEADDLTITYLSCEPYDSDNMFVEPKDGYHFVTCTFSFENTGTDDEYVLSTDFDCFADGLACDQTFIRDDDLSATLSAGRKAQGTVTFEVPDDATVIETEYLTNVWTSNRIVFTIQ